MSIRHFPRYGDKVNDNRRQHPNGFVRAVSFVDGPDEVVVSFDDGLEYYDYEEFRWTWTDAYGGVFLLAQASKAAQATIEDREEKNFLYHLKQVMGEEK